jgi:excisionase family DNA binding protein
MLNLPANTPPLLRLAEASVVFNLSKSTLLRLRRSGSVRTYKTNGGQYMFYRDDIIDFITKNTNGLDKVQESP